MRKANNMGAGRCFGGWIHILSKAKTRSGVALSAASRVEGSQCRLADCDQWTLNLSRKCCSGVVMFCNVVNREGRAGAVMCSWPTMRCVEVVEAQAMPRAKPGFLTGDCPFRR